MLQNITIKNIIFLFILLVVTLISGFCLEMFKESFTSSSEKNRGRGIGDTFAAPLDLLFNTDSSTFDMPTNF